MPTKKKPGNEEQKPKALQKKIPPLLTSTSFDISEDEFYRIVYLAKIGLLESFNNFTSQYCGAIDGVIDKSEEASDESEEASELKPQFSLSKIGPSYSFDPTLLEFIADVLNDWLMDYQRVSQMEQILKNSMMKKNVQNPPG